ncbi:hypothetical protein B0H13DRAFT_1881427 [Mycena leptocephala]|nr:hypothetical protein B0H13DRAFT_1881427 [Mycena leptocephala]
MSYRNRLVFAIFLLCSYLLVWQLVSVNEEYSRAGTGLYPERTSPAMLHTNIAALSVPQKRYRVAVASTFGFHADVYMSLTWALQKVMDRSHTGGTVEVYAPFPLAYEFQSIVATLQLHHGEVKTPDTLIEDIDKNMGHGGIDLVVLGTCEVDLHEGSWPEELLSAWDRRDSTHKFKLVCIAHNIEVDSWKHRIAEWSRRDAIRILTIFEHVAAFRRSFRISADSPDASIRTAGYEYIPVDVHIPVLDIPMAVNERRSRILSDAVIQGRPSTDRLVSHTRSLLSFPNPLRGIQKSGGICPLTQKMRHMLSTQVFQILLSDSFLLDWVIGKYRMSWRI